MVLLATLALITGFGLIARTIYISSTKAAKKEAEQTIKSLASKGGLDDDLESAPSSEVKKKDRSSTDQLIDSVERWLLGSSLIQDEEGQSFMEQLNLELIRAGVNHKYTPERALATALLIWFGGIGWVLFVYYMNILPLIMMIAGVGAIAYWPISKLKSWRTNRQDMIRAEIPFFIQQLYMALSSGMIDIDGAILRVSQTAEDDPYESILAREFYQAYNEYRSGGRDREDALRDIGKRTGIPSVQNLVEAIIQGLSTGTDMKLVLIEYGTQAREIWKQDMRNYKNKKETPITLGVGITMFGAFILYLTPIILDLMATLQNLS